GGGEKRANRCDFDSPIRSAATFDGPPMASRRLARVSDSHRVGDVSRHCAVRTRTGAQRPSFFFRRSLTACGLALPPDAFMTWPTNQPIAFGLVLASAT